MPRADVRLIRVFIARQWECLKLIRALLVRRWDWRTCWRRVDFWMAIATLVLPFAVTMLALQWKPVRVRLRSGP
jgi:hypothetical protein